MQSSSNPSQKAHSVADASAPMGSQRALSWSRLGVLLLLGFVVAPLGWFWFREQCLVNGFGISWQRTDVLLLHTLADVITWSMLLCWANVRYFKPLGQSILSFLGWTSPIPRFRQLISDSMKTIVAVFIATLTITLLIHTVLPDWVNLESPYTDFSHSEKWRLVLLAIGVAPFLEECLFRGVIQSTLCQYMAARWAILGTTVLFTLLHPLYWQNVLAMATTFVLSVVLGYARERSGHVLPPMMGHAFNNGLAALALLTQPPV